ncbi:hypothetical protein A5630_25290 [Mycolicibacterium mucogenicum]|uniref:Uncharacterized protein n=1 Tax=Mycolicibacterium mucogenicum TaxID=56689 RepID=A0A1A3GY14_MYCMU|nr:hypothetical protein [Mycolicibacterium mucogenicum]OBJ40268.1 hypothetical protein A5630_25290 [Mycolicibacterium mucogenicum]
MPIDNDPFGDDNDEAQTEVHDAFDAPEPEEPEPAPAPKKAPAKKAPAKAAAKPATTTVVNNAGSDGKVVLTFKGGSGFDAPWIVIHATDMDDALDQVSGDNAGKLATVMERVQKAGKHFVSLGPAKAAGGSGGNSGGGNSGGGRSNAPQAAQEAPNGEERFCKHGAMVYKTGISKKNGKAWKAFMCGSGDRDDECPAQFLR